MKYKKCVNNKQKQVGGKRMEASKVYYTSFKTSGSENLLQKLRRLCITAGMKNIDFEDKYDYLVKLSKTTIICRY